MSKKYDFGGYATKIDLKCSDGRVIRKDAFKHMDGTIVPLVWQHMHNDPRNILGNALLQHRDNGVYALCTFNDTDAGKNAKQLVEHKDITSLSIHANQLKQKGSDVLHGVIREVSLVLSGANPGAFIDNVSFQHGDGSLETDDTEAIIFTGEDISTDLEHSEDKTVGVALPWSIGARSKRKLAALLRPLRGHRRHRFNRCGVVHRLADFIVDLGDFGRRTGRELLAGLLRMLGGYCFGIFCAFFSGVSARFCCGQQLQQIGFGLRWSLRAP